MNKKDRENWMENINEMLKTADDILIKTVWLILDCNKSQGKMNVNE